MILRVSHLKQPPKRSKTISFPPATIQIGLQQQQWAFRQDGRPPAQPPQRREAEAAVAGDQLAAHHRLAAATDGQSAQGSTGATGRHGQKKGPAERQRRKVDFLRHVIDSFIV